MKRRDVSDFRLASAWFAAAADAFDIIVGKAGFPP
jgi:hypothetical protein